MKYEKLDPQPGPRAPGLAYDAVGPGLYADETAVRLETGHIVAISVERNWMENNSGIVFRAFGRLIIEDGSTFLTKDNQHVESVCSYSCGPFDIESFGVDALAREGLKMVLGDEPTMVDIEISNSENVTEVAIDVADFERNPDKAPPGTVLTPGDTKRPMIPWSAEVRLNASIMHAISNVEATEEDGRFDAAALLNI